MTDSESKTTSLEFSRKQFQLLADKLGELELEPEQRKLLLAILAAARDHVSVVPPAMSSKEKNATPSDAERAAPSDTPETAQSDTTQATPVPPRQIVDTFIPDDVYVLEQGPVGLKITPADIHPPRHRTTTTP